jgi:hypothetical protein
MTNPDRPKLPPYDDRGPSRGGYPLGGFGPEEYEFAPDQSEYDFEDEGYEEAGLRARLRSLGARLLVRVAWLGLAAMLALGSAGIVAATGQSTVPGDRPELTYGADRQLSARLDAAVRDVALLDDDVIVLGNMARQVLANLSQVNQVKLNAAFQDGDTAVAAIDARATRLTASLECTPWTDAREADLARTYSQAMIDRWQQVCVAVASVAPLADDWAGMETGARVAMQVADDMNNHDATGAEALQLATQGRYPEALVKLEQASAALEDAQRIATAMAKVTDVSTLQSWLTRSKGMDDALALLWRTMIDSKGRVTIQVTAALKAVTDAKALLPDNNGIMTVVLYELAGDLTANGISIETAKGQLAMALADLTGGPVLGR